VTRYTDRLLHGSELSQFVLIEVKDELRHVRHVADNQRLSARLLIRLSINTITTQSQSRYIITGKTDGA